MIETQEREEESRLPVKMKIRWNPVEFWTTTTIETDQCITLGFQRKSFVNYSVIYSSFKEEERQVQDQIQIQDDQIQDDQIQVEKVQPNATANPETETDPTDSSLAQSKQSKKDSGFNENLPQPLKDYLKDDHEDDDHEDLDILSLTASNSPRIVGEFSPPSPPPLNKRLIEVPRKEVAFPDVDFNEGDSYTEVCSSLGRWSTASSASELYQFNYSPQDQNYYQKLQKQEELKAQEGIKKTRKIQQIRDKYANNPEHGKAIQKQNKFYKTWMKEDARILTAKLDQFKIPLIKWNEQRERRRRVLPDLTVIVEQGLDEQKWPDSFDTMERRKERQEERRYVSRWERNRYKSPNSSVLSRWTFLNPRSRFNL